MPLLIDIAVKIKAEHLLLTNWKPSAIIDNIKKNRLKFAELLTILLEEIAE